MKTISLHSIVLLIGPSGAGKSTLAKTLFSNHEIVSSDQIREELTGDFRIQTANSEVFFELHRRVELKINMGQRAVVDATNLRARDRKFFVDLARKNNVNLYYLVIDRPLDEKLRDGGWRLGVDKLIERHDEIFRSNLSDINRGDNVATVIQHTEEFNVVKRGSVSEMITQGNFEHLMVIGDVHGNYPDAEVLASKADAENAFTMYLGDIVDYGDNNLETFSLVYDRIMNGKALMVWGNHERKLDSWIKSGFGQNGYRGKIGHGMKKTIDEIENLADKNLFRAKWRAVENMSNQHYVYNNMLFTHAAATPGLWEIDSHRPYGEHGQLAFFGQVDKNTPLKEDGYPNRLYDWVNTVPENKIVVVGHDILSKNEPTAFKNQNGSTVIFLDTGSSKGGKLSHIMYKIKE